MIKLRNISKSYQRPGEGELQVLKEVSFEVGPWSVSVGVEKG